MVYCCKNIIKRLDIFGILVTFHINNDIKYRTIYGGIFAIIFFFFFIRFHNLFRIYIYNKEKYKFYIFK